MSTLLTLRNVSNKIHHSQINMASGKCITVNYYWYQLDIRCYLDLVSGEVGASLPPLEGTLVSGDDVVIGCVVSCVCLVFLVLFLGRFVVVVPTLTLCENFHSSFFCVYEYFSALEVVKFRWNSCHTAIFRSTNKVLHCEHNLNFANTVEQYN